MTSPATLPEAAIDALAQGRKIDAIRIVREQLGLGLAEAKQAVEQYPAGTAQPASRHREAADAARGLPVEALAALAEGRKIDAIRIVREQLGLGLAEAKQAVEQYPAGTAQPASRHREAADAARGLPVEALAALAEGRKIDAIRMTREALGVGLKEAKQAIDRYQAAARQAGAGDLRSGNAVERTSGGGAKLVIGLLVAVTLVGLYLLQF